MAQVSISLFYFAQTLTKTCIYIERVAGAVNAAIDSAKIVAVGAKGTDACLEAIDDGADFV